MMFELTIQLLVFLLSFVVFYALLKKLEIFSVTINAILSFVFSLYVVYFAIKFPANIAKVISFALLILFALFVVSLISKGFRNK